MTHVLVWVNRVAAGVALFWYAQDWHEHHWGSPDRLFAALCLASLGQLLDRSRP